MRRGDSALHVALSSVATLVCGNTGSAHCSLALASMLRRIGSPGFVHATALTPAAAHDISRALGHGGGAFAPIRPNALHPHGWVGFFCGKISVFSRN